MIDGERGIGCCWVEREEEREEREEREGRSIDCLGREKERDQRERGLWGRDRWRKGDIRLGFYNRNMN